MRALIQRVTKASVKTENNITGNIAQGLLILLGIEDADTAEDMQWLSRKICNMRIFDNEAGQMDLSIKDVNGEILVVSQFTLHASTKKGNRPSYIKAARPDKAIPLYEQAIRQFENDLGKPVQTGKFGADMQVELINDGPVTIWLDTKSKE